jgi:nitrogen fixation/metabolism regulation signal transduction histidine kinase
MRLFGSSKLSCPAGGGSVVFVLCLTMPPSKFRALGLDPIFEPGQNRCDCLLTLRWGTYSTKVSTMIVTGAIAHEVRQPLAAIVANAGAALRWLGRSPPDHDEVRAALNRIQNEGRRTGEVFDAIRALFRRGDQGRQRIDVNEIIVEVLRSLRGELRDHEVETRPKLTELPLVDGHRGQLRQVIFNLVHNALEAMDTTSDRRRVLQVTTELRGRDAISVAVEDSGPGIDPKQLDGIFGAFVTGKPHGMGLGLAVCRMIIEPPTVGMTLDEPLMFAQSRSASKPSTT